MGDPKKRRRKYSSLAKKWEKSRIDEESKLIKEYGLKNKREIRKADSKLSNFKRHAKRLVALNNPQAEKEKKQLLDKLKSLSLIKEDSSMDNILDLSLKDILERRLQTILFRKGMAKSVKASRQFITHEHVMVNNTKITVPSYLVNSQEESKISFSTNSPFFDDTHPERLPSAPKKSKSNLKEVKRIVRRK